MGRSMGLCSSTSDDGSVGDADEHYRGVGGAVREIPEGVSEVPPLVGGEAIHFVKDDGQFALPAALPPQDALNVARRDRGQFVQPGTQGVLGGRRLARVVGPLRGDRNLVQRPAPHVAVGVALVAVDLHHLYRVVPPERVLQDVGERGLPDTAVAEHGDVLTAGRDRRNSPLQLLFSAFERLKFVDRGGCTEHAATGSDPRNRIRARRTRLLSRGSANRPRATRESRTRLGQGDINAEAGEFRGQLLGNRGRPNGPSQA